MSFLVLGVLAFLASWLGTRLARAYALRQQLIDTPDDPRRNHLRATPRGGGIAMVVVMLAACLWLAFTDQLAWLWLGLGLALVGGIGWWDDHRPLAARWRLLVHVIAAGSLALAGLGFGWPWWLVLGAFFAAVVLTNIWNFMDGIDGIAASQAMLIAAAIAWLLAPGVIQGFALVVALAVAGFLPWNFPKAKIFMGDVGSGALGYVMAALWAMGFAEDVRLGWLLLLPFSAFLIDASLTLLRRILRRERWWQAHSTHSYQLWARRLRSHVPVSLAYASWTAAGIIGACLLADASLLRILLAVGIVCLAGVVCWFAIRTWNAQRSRA
ncbi:MAG: lipopolysaccharide biosynthesis protein [Pseudomonadota bacterium]|nr:lipopolysaccharide biosynthesis protein [Pseudomonadota bacterium]